MGRERVYRTQAIILKRADLFEADRLLTLYTPDRGKMRAIAKGVRKPTSRKAGHLELFTLSQLLLAQGQNLDIITQAEALESYLPLRKDLWRASYACYVAELLDQFAEESIPNPRLFYLLRDTLGWLATSEDLAGTTRYYELRLLELAGYRPEFFQCVGCWALLQAEEHHLFSPVEGGVLCPRCGPRSAGAMPLSLSALKVLRFWQTRDYELSRRLRISPALHREVERVLYRYITFILECNLKSVAFLNTLRRQNATGQGLAME